MAELQLQQTAYAYRNKYQTVQALKGVDYQFESGRFYALVGRSGSGKTTLLSLLAGLDFPTEGKGCFGQAWSVGEMLRVFEAIEGK